MTIVASDMRTWVAPEQADILVSELLGSFGDNELSPECLDGAQKFLKPGGISIPAASTSQLQPITAAKLWNDANVRCGVESVVVRCSLGPVLRSSDALYKHLNAGSLRLTISSNCAESVLNVAMTHRS